MFQSRTCALTSFSYRGRGLKAEVCLMFTKNKIKKCACVCRRPARLPLAEPGAGCWEVRPGRCGWGKGVTRPQRPLLSLWVRQEPPEGSDRGDSVPDSQGRSPAYVRHGPASVGLVFLHVQNDSSSLTSEPLNVEAPGRVSHLGDSMHVWSGGWEGTNRRLTHGQWGWVHSSLLPPPHHGHQLATT